MLVEIHNYMGMRGERIDYIRCKNRYKRTFNTLICDIPEISTLNIGLFWRDIE